MRILSLSSKLVVFTVHVGLVMTLPSLGQLATEPERTLVTLQNGWAEARVHGDAAFLENFYAKEFKLTAMNGSVVERAAAIARSSSTMELPETIKDEDLKVLVYGDTAVMTGLEHVRRTQGDSSREVALRFTNVLVLRDGRWQLVASQSTLAPPVAGEGADGIYRRGPGVVMPEVLHTVTASYSEPARKRRIKGVVRIEVVVDADGHLREPHVVKSAASDYSDPKDREAAFTLDRMAIDAVRQYTFTPGTFHNKPVPVLTVVETSFNLQ